MTRSNRFARAVVLLFLILSPMANASGVITLTGNVFSILPDEYVIQAGRELFHLRKDSLTSAQRKQIDKASAHEITVDVPMDAITQVRGAAAGKPMKPKY